MINKLDDKLKEYSNEYFMNEFIKSKPNTEYNKLNYKCIGLFVGLCIVFVLFVFSFVYRSYLGQGWYWCSLSLLLCLLVSVFYLGELENRRLAVLSEMASAYLESHGELEKIQDYGLLTTWKEKMQYIHSIRNSYRADIVKRSLGNDYSIDAIKALKDAVEIKGVKLDLNFVSVCSFIALSVSLVAWFGFDIKNGWPIVLGFFLILLGGYVAFDYCVKLFKWHCKCKKYKILRETLSFMLYDYM